jgi:hypothetical protein
MGSYKGDFLYRTTDFAIWTTVEVGLGITAGSIATLRPLMKQALEITRSASTLPWSKPSFGNSAPLQSGQQLSTLKPSIIKKSVTITTSRARRESVSSDEEIFLGSTEAWQRPEHQRVQGLPGYITSTVLDERDGHRKTAEKSRKHMADLERGRQERSGSPGAASDSTKSTGKTAKVHERF